MLKTGFLMMILLLSLRPHTGACNDGMATEAPKSSWHHEVKPGPFQQEIDKLAPGQVLRLPKGTYQGPIHIKVPGITIEGDPGAVITGNNRDSVIVIEAHDVTIKNLTITGSGTSYTQADSGIGLRSVNSAKLLNNKIIDCLFGIDLYSGEGHLIEGNTIVSKNLEIGLRGDAMRLWNVKDVHVMNNHWSHSRDVVAWYSKKVTFKGNEGTDSRYSIHSMYSEGIRIQNNKFKRNTVGIFLMYGSDFIITNNHVERSLGATGMGIGLKESSNIIAQNNTINYCAVGVMVDNSPFKMGSRNWFHGNNLAFNGKGVLLNNDLPGGEFKKNVFLGNLEDVESENRHGSKSLWNGNKWDKYAGFDQDNNSVGDTPYIVRKFGDTIKGSDPKSSFFYGTPLFTLVGIIEEVANVGEPVVVLTDKNPRLVKN